MDWMTSKIQCDKLSLQHHTPNEHVKMQAWLRENIVANKVNITFNTHDFGSATAKALADGFLKMGEWVRRKVDVNVLSLDTLIYMIEGFQGLPADDIRHLPPLLKIAKGRFSAHNFRAKFSENCIDAEDSEGEEYEPEQEDSEAEQSEAEESEADESEAEESEELGSDAEGSEGEESDAKESENYRFCNLGAKQDILVSMISTYFHGYYSAVSFERIDCSH
ncbi:hypothetical protein Ddc_15549 [Ditylenchus destructor]|nr:hypothetical protein Ddc_15549 [Ditylenchus destructor]